MERRGGLNRGWFITFEGPEGSGKSTHSRLLSQFLRRRGYEVVTTREPGGTSIGEKIRRILLDPSNARMTDETELFLYMASRAQLVHETIAPVLERGKIVISDRFLDATLAYQGYGGKIKLGEILSMARLATSHIEPHLTILLDIDSSSGLRRAGARPDRLEQKALRYHAMVRKGYLALARAYPQRIKVFSAKEDVATIQKKIRQLVLHLIPKTKGQIPKTDYRDLRTGL